MANGKVWALVPARGGSKSIPYKNLVRLAGVPMLDYGVRAAKAAAIFERIVCSTEDERIAGHASSLGIEVDRRPPALAGDEARVSDVAREWLGRVGEASWPETLFLIQPTSPFLLPEHCRALLDAARSAPEARSGQTVCEITHNHHAFNQRVVEAGRVRFRFRDERARAYNKQRKLKLHVFGNVLLVRTDELMQGHDFFAEPSVAVEIPRPYDLDLDTAHDLAVAEALIAGGAVTLPHMAGAPA